MNFRFSSRFYWRWSVSRWAFCAATRTVDRSSTTNPRRSPRRTRFKPSPMAMWMRRFATRKNSSQVDSVTRARVCSTDKPFTCTIHSHRWKMQFHLRHWSIAAHSHRRMSSPQPQRCTRRVISHQILAIIITIRVSHRISIRSRRSSQRHRHRRPAFRRFCLCAMTRWVSPSRRTWRAQVGSRLDCRVRFHSRFCHDKVPAHFSYVKASRRWAASRCRFVCIRLGRKCSIISSLGRRRAMRSRWDDCATLYGEISRLNNFIIIICRALQKNSHRCALSLPIIRWWRNCCRFRSICPVSTRRSTSSVTTWMI